MPKWLDDINRWRRETFLKKKRPGYLLDKQDNLNWKHLERRYLDSSNTIIGNRWKDVKDFYFGDRSNIGAAWGLFVLASVGWPMELGHEIIESATNFISTDGSKKDLERYPVAGRIFRGIVSVATAPISVPLTIGRVADKQLPQWGEIGAGLKFPNVTGYANDAWVTRTLERTRLIGTAGLKTAGFTIGSPFNVPRYVAKLGRIMVRNVNNPMRMGKDFYEYRRMKKIEKIQGKIAHLSGLKSGNEIFHNKMTDRLEKRFLRACVGYWGGKKYKIKGRQEAIPEIFDRAKNNIGDYKTRIKNIVKDTSGIKNAGFLEKASDVQKREREAAKRLRNLNKRIEQQEKRGFLPAEYIEHNKKRLDALEKNLILLQETKKELDTRDKGGVFRTKGEGSKVMKRIDNLIVEETEKIKELAHCYATEMRDKEKIHKRYKRREKQSKFEKNKKNIREKYLGKIRKLASGQDLVISTKELLEDSKYTGVDDPGLGLPRASKYKGMGGEKRKKQFKKDTEKCFNRFKGIVNEALGKWADDFRIEEIEVAPEGKITLTRRHSKVREGSVYNKPKDDYKKVKIEWKREVKKKGKVVGVEKAGVGSGTISPPVLAHGSSRDGGKGRGK